MTMAMLMCGAAWAQAFNGMDRNDYPGDSLLGALHKSFSYTSYWLNVPPDEKRKHGRGNALCCEIVASALCCCGMDDWIRS